MLSVMQEKKKCISSDDFFFNLMVKYRLTKLYLCGSVAWFMTKLCITLNLNLKEGNVCLNMQRLLPESPKIISKNLEDS